MILCSTYSIIALILTFYKLFLFVRMFKAAKLKPLFQSSLSLVIAVALICKIWFYTTYAWYTRGRNGVIAAILVTFPSAPAIVVGYLLALFLSEVLVRDKLKAHSFILEHRKLFFAFSTLLIVCELVFSILRGELGSMVGITVADALMYVAFFAFVLSYYIPQTYNLIQFLRGKLDASASGSQTAPQKQAKGDAQSKKTLIQLILMITFVVSCVAALTGAGEFVPFCACFFFLALTPIFSRTLQFECFSLVCLRFGVYADDWFEMSFAFFLPIHH